ncbi:hypothetical protein R3P38DRAFT_2788041 [Favolaschia claudopus]|uniref:Uncharacterized protein n=1 Tax=Favolaschia claudopus TaxID=2862362 RepID=A0AAW0ALV3_9AGAR
MEASTVGEYMKASVALGLKFEYFYRGASSCSVSARCECVALMPISWRTDLASPQRYWAHAVSQSPVVAYRLFAQGSSCLSKLVSKPIHLASLLRVTFRSASIRAPDVKLLCSYSGQAFPPQYRMGSVLLLCLSGSGNRVHQRIHRLGHAQTNSRMKGYSTHPSSPHFGSIPTLPTLALKLVINVESMYTLLAPNLKAFPDILHRFRQAHVSVPSSLYDSCPPLQSQASSPPSHLSCPKGASGFIASRNDVPADDITMGTYLRLGADATARVHLVWFLTDVPTRSSSCPRIGAGASSLDATGLPLVSGTGFEVGRADTGYNACVNALGTIHSSSTLFVPCEKGAAAATYCLRPSFVVVVRSMVEGCEVGIDPPLIAYLEEETVAREEGTPVLEMSRTIGLNSRMQNASTFTMYPMCGLSRSGLCAGPKLDFSTPTTSTELASTCYPIGGASC